MSMALSLSTSVKAQDGDIRDEQTTSTSSRGLETESSSTGAESLSSASTQSVISFLEKLRCPKSAAIGRDRKVRCSKLPPLGVRRSKARSHSDPKSVVPLQRAREFPDEMLNVSSGKLFCSACREELSLKVSVIKNHMKSAKHVASKKKCTLKECRERDIAESLIKHNESTHQEGESLPVDQQVYRVKVASTFLCAGVPISKVDQFRDILQENALRLTDCSHMANLIERRTRADQA